MKPDGRSQREILDASGGPLYFKPGEVARIVGVPPSTIRHWQEVFSSFLHPVRTAKGRNVFSREDLRVFQVIHHLLHREGLGSREARERLPEVLRNPGAVPQVPCPSEVPTNPPGAPEDPTEFWRNRVRELENRLEETRQEHRRLQRELESLVRLVAEWARTLEEESSAPTLNGPPG